MPKLLKIPWEFRRRRNPNTLLLNKIYKRKLYSDEKQRALIMKELQNPIFSVKLPPEVLISTVSSHLPIRNLSPSFLFQAT
jgi:hypothetical protein